MHDFNDLTQNKWLLLRIIAKTENKPIAHACYVKYYSRLPLSQEGGSVEMCTAVLVPI